MQPLTLLLSLMLQIPALQDGVIVLGYPRGGDNLCITSGVVSRVDVNTYAHSNTA